MGIALFALSGLFAPLQAAASRFVPVHSRAPAIDAWRAEAPRTAPPNAPRRASSRPGAPTRGRPAGTLGSAPDDGMKVAPGRPPTLRVLRNIEADMPPGSSGRMAISGRMADVCAELDRLAALENTRRGPSR